MPEQSAPARATPPASADHAPPDAAHVILGYLVRHPGAVDSLEGIARWRLLEETVRRRLEETEGALRWLVARGLVTQITRPHGTPLFRIDEARREDALRLLDLHDEARSAPAAAERPEAGAAGPPD